MKVRSFRHVGEDKRTKYNLLIDDMTLKETKALEFILRGTIPAEFEDEDTMYRVIDTILDEIG